MARMCAMPADQTLDILHPSSSLGWEKWPPTPVRMINAHSVYLNKTLYVGGGTASESDLRADARLYSFKPGVDSSWTVIDTPTFLYAPVVHDSELQLVGGREYSTREVTNKIFTMRNGKFVEVLPPMKETRDSPSAVSSGSALVVAGGYSTRDLSSVEVFKGDQWTTAPSLPSAASNMKPAFHGDQWYLIQSNKNVLRVSLQALISGTDQSPWETLPDAPNDFSAAAFFGGYLLSIGGGNYHNLTTTIHAFSSRTQSWEHAADLPVPLIKSSAVMLPTGELMVIGRKRANYNTEVFRAILKAPLVVSDVRISIPKLHLLYKYGINLMEALSKDYERFYITSKVQFLVRDRKKAPTLSPKHRVELIFNVWERSKRPTYPPTWEGLFTVLRNMDLCHLAEQIGKCVTGSLPETEDSPQPSESEVQLSPGDKEQPSVILETTRDSLGNESALTAELNQSLQDELNHLIKKVQNVASSVGSFMEHNSLEVNEFSGQDVKKFYVASLYYMYHQLCNFITTIHIHVVLSLNEEAHLLAVEQSYKGEGAVKGPSFAIEFNDACDTISLDIPMPRGIEQDGWRIYPLVAPFVTRGEVDSFKPRTSIPSFQLKATSLPRGEVQDLCYLLNVVGAKEPKNKLLVEVKLLENTHEIPPSLLSVEQSQTFLSLSSATPSPPSNVWLQQCNRTGRSVSGGQSNALDIAWPSSQTGSLQSIEYPAITLDRLVSHVGIDKDLLDKECSDGHLIKISSLLLDWLTYATALGFSDSETRDITDNLQLSNSTHAMKALRVLKKWHRRFAFDATYLRLVKVCLDLSDALIAAEICKMVKEDSSQPPPITGDKREATDHTEQVPPKRPRS